jgi:hypothetical protein
MRVLNMKKHHRQAEAFRFVYLNFGPRTRSQHLEGNATGQLNKGFPVVFLSPRANAELIGKFHVALHLSHAAPLPQVKGKVVPVIN